MGLPYQMWFTINEHLVYPLVNSHFSMENQWKSPFYSWENPQKFYGHFQWPHGYRDGPESAVQRIIPKTNCTDEYPNDGTHIPGKPLFLGKMRGFHRWKQFFYFFAQGGDIPSTISQLRTSRTSKPSKSGRARTCRDFSPKKMVV